ncbi:acyltransferase family protein [Aurantivibrio infirmus]
MSDSVWARYKEAINVKTDLRDAFFRRHQRYATLDGARAITVLLMVLFHVMFGIVVLFDENIDRVDTFIASMPRYIDWFWQSQGSDPLFMLCGLLVSYTLFREYDKTSTIQVKRFYIRRLMRIFPVFILALIVFVPADKDNFENLWSNIIFMSNYIPGQRHVIPVGWSLDVQMHFYFLLPFLIFIMYAIPWRITYLSVLCIGSVVWRYFAVTSDPEIFERPFYEIVSDREFGSHLANVLYYDLDVRIGAFFMGMLTAYLHYYHADKIKAYLTKHLLINTVLVLAAVAMIVGSFYFPIINKNAEMYVNFDPTFNLWYLVLNKYIYTFGLSMLLLLALCPVGLSKWVEWVLSWPIWHPVAQLIFPIYLFHMAFLLPAAIITFGTIDRESIEVVHEWQIYSLFFLTVFFTMGFAALVHVYIEKPFLNMREPDGVKDHSAIPNTAINAEKV